MRVHQLLPSLAKGDAISNEAIAIRDLLRSWGHESEIYAMNIDPRLVRQCRRYQKLKAGPDEAIIYHYSIGCREVSEHFLKMGGRKLIIYHNITPPEYFEGYHPLISQLLREGREMLSAFKDCVEVALGDSDYNVEELRQIGYRNTSTLPILLDLAPFAQVKPDPKMLKRLNAGEYTTFLFTGRVAPNKRQEDVIKTFAWYHHHIDKASQLVLVGNATLPKYLKELHDTAKALQVEDYVIIAGHLTFSQLVACYQSADLFLSMSEHEGFCVPLLEAMHFQIPILAYNATGVPSTLGNAGILFNHKNPKIVAEMAHLLICDPQLKAQVIRRQDERLLSFAPERTAGILRSAMDQLAERA